MKTFGYIILGIFLLQFLRRPAATATQPGANTANFPALSFPILSPGQSLTPAQIQALQAGAAVGQVTGLQTDSSGDLIVSVCPCDGVSPVCKSLEQDGGVSLDEQAWLNGCPGPAVSPVCPKNGIIGALPGL